MERVRYGGDVGVGVMSIWEDVVFYSVAFPGCWVTFGCSYGVSTVQ